MERPEKDEDLQRTQQEPQMKQQAVKIATLQEDCLLQSTAIWEQLWEAKKKGQL